MVHAVESLFHVQIAAVRTAGSVEPGSLIRPRGLHHEGIIILPLPYRVAVPTWVGIFWEFSSVCPDDPPHPVKLVQHYHADGCLKDLSRPEFVKVFAGHSLGFTGKYGIICPRGENASGSTARFRAAQRFLRQGSIGWLMLRLAVFGHGTCSEYAEYSDWIVSWFWFPNSRNVMAWSGG